MSERSRDIKLIVGIKTLLDENYYKIEYWNRIEYQKFGYFHRLDGPAIHYLNGHDIYYVDGLKHRVNDWAERCGDGTRKWWYEGQLHNPNGPAVIDYSTTAQWPLLEFWRHGVQYKDVKTTDEWIIKQIIE